MKDRSFRMRVHDQFFDDLKELRRREKDLPDNTEMVMRLVQRALTKALRGVDTVITKK